MAGGYMGRVLRVDLSSGQIGLQQVSQDDQRSFIGGSGLAARILLEEAPPGADPLHERNPLIFMTGPLTGTPVPLTGRHAVVARSPLTGIFGESDVGGTWGNMLKRSGFDGIVVVGRADRPVYLWVHDGAAEIRPADHMWGLDVYQADEAIKSETHGQAVTGLIGPAGERLARISAVVFDGKHARAAGRCGLGAVLGSKNLKGIAVHGNSKPQIAFPEELKQALAGKAAEVAARTPSLRDFGTSGSIISIEKRGDLPIQNWLKGSWAEGAQSVSGQRMAESILRGRFFCTGCPIGCGREVQVTEGPYAPVDGAGPEYETLGMFGGCCGTSDLEAIAKANELCNRYGLDTISTGGVIAMALEAFEHGLLTSRDTGGFELRWGDPAALLWLIERIGEVSGVGQLLAQGVKSMAEAWGPEAADMAVHVKGLELPAHDPRGHFSLALGYATSSRGACHLQSFSHNFDVGWTMPDIGITEVQNQFAVEGKSGLVVKLQNLMGVYDSLKMCKFAVGGGVSVTDQAKWLSLVTGWNYDVAAILETGERIFNLKRMINVRWGVRRADDTLPKRILTHPRGEGLAADKLPPLEPMLEEYYRIREWDEDGVPKAGLLERLGLSWASRQ